MVADAADQIGEIGLRIDAVQLTGLDQGVEDRGTLAAGVRAREGPVASPERQQAGQAQTPACVMTSRGS